MEGIYPAVSAARVQELRLDIIANNLANANTTGFKREVPLFDAVAPFPGVSTVDESSGVELAPVYGALRSVVTDSAPGVIRETGDPLDAAIEGDGFFAIQTSGGVRYTRNGHFTLDAEGQIVTSDGFPVLGSGGPITLPTGTVAVDPNGRVSVDGSEVDTFQIVKFSDPAHLVKVGANLVEAGGQPAVPVEPIRLVPGALETSNVNPVQEMVAMVEVLRLYEAAQKVMQTIDAAMGRAVNEVGSV